MKFFAISALLLGTSPLFAQLPVVESLDNGSGEGSDWFSNHAAVGSDFFERVTTSDAGGNFAAAIGGFDGAMWAMEDVDGLGSVGIWTMKTIAGAGSFAGREVRIKFATARTDGRFEQGNDNILIQYAFDGGIAESGVPGSGSYATIGRLIGDDFMGASGGQLRQDTNGDGMSSIAEGGQVVTGTLTEFIFSIPNGGTDLSIRIVADIDGGSEEVAFDDISVSGTAATSETPVLANIEGAATSFSEGGAAVQVTNTLSISDADSSELAGATVGITSNFDVSEDALLFTDQSGISGLYDSGSGVLTLSGTASLANYQTALRSVTYDNTDDSDAVMATRTISFKVTDELSNESVAATRNVDIETALNPASALPIAGYCESFETDGEGTRYGSNHAVTDLSADYFERFDTGALPSGYVGAVSGPGLDGSFVWVTEDTVGTTGGTGMVTLAPLTVTGFTGLNVSLALEQGRAGDLDQWENSDFVKVSYSMDGAPFEIVGAFYGDDSNGSDGILRQDANLNGVSSDLDGGLEVPADLTNYTFPITLTGDTLVVRVEVSSTGSEELAFDNICINGSMTTNSAPILAGVEGTTIAYGEGDPAVNVTNSLTIADTDDTELEGAIVEFVGTFSQSQDQLLFTDQNGITGSYDAVAGKLSLSGTATLAQYESALRSVQFNNSEASDAAPGIRMVRFSVNDGDSGSNLDQVRSIDVRVVLDPPVAMTSSGYCESFETDGSGTRYASNHASVGADDFFDRVAFNMLPAGYPAAIGGDLDGLFLWVAEDTGNTLGGEGSIDLQTQIVTGWDSLKVSIALGNGRNGEDRFENNDHIKIGYTMDGGPFTVVGAFYGNSPAVNTAGRLVQDLDLDGSSSDGDGGLEVPAALTTYTFDIPDTGENLVVGVRVSSNGSEELAFDNICIMGTDVEPPTATLASPANGASLTAIAMNAQGYIDVTFSDNEAIDGATVTDVGAEFTLTGAAASGVVVNGAPALVSGETYRYSFTGGFGFGAVGVNFTESSFSDVSATSNVASVEGFTVLNSPPTLNPDTIERYPSQSVKTTVGFLTSNDSDPDMNGPLTVTNVSYTGGNGGSVSLSNGTVFYTPAAGYFGADSFEYTAEDSLGASSSGTVNVNIIEDNDPSLNISGPPTLPDDGTAVITGAGIPGRVYRVQTADSGSPMTWSDAGTVTADPANGVLNYVDPGPLPPARFYRFVFP